MIYENVCLGDVPTSLNAVFFKSSISNSFSAGFDVEFVVTAKIQHHVIMPYGFMKAVSTSLNLFFMRLHLCEKLSLE